MRRWRTLAISWPSASTLTENLLTFALGRGVLHAADFLDALLQECP